MNLDKCQSIFQAEIYLIFAKMQKENGHQNILEKKLVQLSQVLKFIDWQHQID